jgi:hypothetical protein
MIIGRGYQEIQQSEDVIKKDIAVENGEKDIQEVQVVKRKEGLGDILTVLVVLIMVINYLVNNVMMHGPRDQDQHHPWMTHLIVRHQLRGKHFVSTSNEA